MKLTSSGDILAQYSQGQRNFRGLNLQKLELPLACLSHADFANSDLQQINWSGADLIKVNFSKANLRGAKLIGADLSGANLVEADLRGAMLSGAIMIGAYLSRANLEQAVLSGAILNGAILRDCLLKDVNLVGADLTGADLSGAQARQSDLADANLEGTILPDGSVIYTPEEQDASIALDFSSDNTFGVARPDVSAEVDNETLIQRFLTTPTDQVIAQANPDLRIVPITPGASELQTCDGEPIAKFVHGAEQPTVSLWQETSFTTLVGEVLAALDFLPRCELSEPARVEYHRCPRLPGYGVKFESVRRLWKDWWMANQAQEQAPDMQVWWQGQWHPVQEISFAAFPDGEITISLPDTEEWILAPDQKIPWLERENTHLSAVSAPGSLPLNWTEIRQIIQYETGCVIVQTALGELRIQGEQLQCWLEADSLNLSQLTSAE